jgi:hypothetical protein
MHLEGKTKEGLAAIRKLSQLIHTSQTLSGDLAAIRLLNFERNFITNLKIKNVEPVSEELVATYERVARGWQGVLLLGWESALPEEIKPYLKPEHGLCGPVNDMFTSSPTGYYYALVPTVHFESNLSDFYDRAMKLQTEMLKLCRFDNLLPLLNPVMAPEAHRTELADTVMEKLPYIRRVVGLSRLRKAQPDGMKLYREFKMNAPKEESDEKK